jgi:hypothetical protein
MANEPDDNKPSNSIKRFMALEGMSRPFYNLLRELGLIKEMAWGGWRRISPEERVRFHQRMENLTPELAAELQAARARLSARGRKAAEASVASAKHVSVSAATRRKAMAKRKQRKAGAP